MEQHTYITRSFLCSLPWSLAGVGFVAGLFLFAVVDEPACWWLWAGLIVGGLLLGWYGKYRSRFAVTQGLASIGGLIAFMLVLCAAPAAVLLVLFGHPELVGGVMGLIALNFGVAAWLGWRRGAAPWQQAVASGQWDREIGLHADLNARIFTPTRDGVAGDTGARLWWVALGVNLPLFAVLAFGEGADVVLVIVTLVVLLPVLLRLTLRFAALLPTYVNLQRYERRHDFRFVSDQQPALAQVRSTFWLRHWLCRPEDRVAPMAAGSGRRARRQR